jgi:multicomponent Na+:H+ antiporter subunit E
MLSLWWILSEGIHTGQTFALIFALLAALSSLALIPPGNQRPWRQQLRGGLRFIPFFLWQSLLGGVDVARRAFPPRLPLCPSIISYPLGLAKGWPQVFFLNTVSLLPGTLAMKLEGDTVRIHLLDGRGDPMSTLRQVEERVAALFPEHRSGQES